MCKKYFFTSFIISKHVIWLNEKSFNYDKAMFSVLLSNPLTYAVCLEELGQDVVQKFQGRAPSGRTFNEIVLDHQGINLIFYCYL